MRIALYRILYGEDFILESVLSVLEHVDKVVICWADRPWDSARSVVYKGTETEIAWTEGEPIDGWRVRLREAHDSDWWGNEVVTVPFHCETPVNQYTRMCNEVVIPRYGVPDLLLCLEPDHVWDPPALGKAIATFANNGLRCATSRQVELWKGTGWRVPERPHRTGTVFWDLRGRPMPETKHQAEPRSVDFSLLSQPVFNMGFAVSSRTMRLKHLCALSFSRAIGDSEPNEGWLEDKWENWEPGMGNLEISKGYEHTIPHVIPFDESLVPEMLKERCDAL